MDGVLRTEKAVLLGLVTLLGTTTTLAGALAGLFISAAAAILVCGLNAVLPESENVPEWVRWSVMAVLGFSTSWLLTGLSAFLLPLTASQLIYLRIAGVSPLIFYAAARDVSPRSALFVWVDFAVVLLAAGAFRELLGRGTLWGNIPPWGYSIPADFMASPFGAFLVPATIVLAARILDQLVSNRTKGSRV